MIWIFDDDDIFKFVISFQIKKIFPTESIKTFRDLELGISALQSEIQLPDILLVDINFPDKCGWDFLEKIHTACELNKGNTKIFMVSSSISKTDKEKTITYPFVQKILEKPISDDTILQCFKNP